MANCNNTTNNACADCTNACVDTFSTNCIYIDASVDVDNVSYSTGDTLSEFLNAFSNSFSAYSGWLLDGNTLGQTQSIGTLNNYRFPMIVNGTEVFGLEKINVGTGTVTTIGDNLRPGDITRKGILYSVIDSDDDSEDVWGNTSWGYHALGNLTIGVGGGYQNNAFGWNSGFDISTGFNNICIGAYSGTGETSGSNNVYIGTSATGFAPGNTDSVAIGTSAIAADDSVTIGNQATANHTGCIVLGSSAASTGNYQCIIGGSSSIITSMYIGGGVTATVPAAIQINGTSGSGSNVQSGNFTIATGKGTGTGICGNLGLQTSVPVASGSSAQTLGDRIKVLGKYTTLSEGVATTFASITIPTGTVMGGEVLLSVHAEDAADFQCRTLRAIFSVVNKAGTLTTTLSTPEEAVAVSSGTLTCTITLVDAGSGVLNFKADATSSLVQTTLRCNAQFKKNFGTGTFS